MFAGERLLPLVAACCAALRLLLLRSLCGTVLSTPLHASAQKLTAAAAGRLDDIPSRAGEADGPADSSSEELVAAGKAVLDRPVAIGGAGGLQQLAALVVAVDRQLTGRQGRAAEQRDQAEEDKAVASHVGCCYVAYWGG